MRRQEINRTNAPQILRFFDLCFKQGVIDACNYADDFEAREFLEKHKAAWDFGVLGEPDDFDWELWRFTLYRWGRANKFKHFVITFVYGITKKNHVWYFLPYCMRFYLMGIEEWLQNPNPVKLEQFKQENKVHWANVPAAIRKITTNDMIAQMQEFAYLYRRVPKEERQFNAVTLDAFARAMHDLTRPYATRKKVRIEDYETEDF